MILISAQERMRNIRFRIFLIAVICFSALAAVLAERFFSCKTVVASQARGIYYRSVYVLQSLNEAAAEEKAVIPAGIIYSDETESLLHHPDKILVLGRIAEDLASLRAEFPDAWLFEAYARMALGERAEAARLLAHYVAENEYRPAYYALLCENLAESGDYVSLLVFSREWKEKDPSCNLDRSRYVLAAFYNSGRFDEALEAARAEGGCLGWEAEVYAAKAILGQGDEDHARQVLLRAESRFAENAAQIRRLWDLLRGKSVL
ncbi:MAG: hypothetical protein LBS65_07620 [Desulfovibrio sp.]|jgi:tetratricopeptide (TPR) repeat protein|nr:hypothetical protein [Desulfovibrio sp.]